MLLGLMDPESVQYFALFVTAYSGESLEELFSHAGFASMSHEMDSLMNLSLSDADKGLNCNQLQLDPALSIYSDAFQGARE